MKSSRHLGLVGPTASGKSSVALSVAERVGDVEIVSVDSMQVYRGMDVGTAKPTDDERRRVRHHLIDVADPAEEWSVVRFRDAARAAVADIEGRGRRALLVGGTGLYLRAVIDDLEFPGEDPGVRAEIEAELEAGGVERLYAELASHDPVAAGRIESRNERRIVRALEVVRSTGRPFSSFGPGLRSYPPPVMAIDLVGLRHPRPVLRRRISERLALMRAAGLVDEVKRLVTRPEALSRTAAQAIGYQEIIAHIEGRVTEDEAFAEAEARTARFARRQLKWFERDPRISWIDLDGASVNPGDAQGHVLTAWSACHASA